MKDYVYWSKEPETMSLCHHGVKGMKWGVRRTPEQLGHRTLAKGTRVSRIDHGSEWIKNKYSVSDADRARDRKGNKGKIEDTYVLNRDISAPSYVTVRDSLNGILKKNPNVIRNSMLKFHNETWKHGESDPESVVSNRYVTYDTVASALKKRGITEKNTNLQKYNKLYMDEGYRQVKSMVDNDMRSIQRDPSKRKKFYDQAMRYIETDWFKDLRSELYSDLGKKGYNAITDEDQYRSGHDSIQIIDQNALTKISSKPVSFLEEFKARKFYDSWSKYIN